MNVLVIQCPTLGDPMDCRPPGSSVHGIFQARILEWIAIPSLEDLPNPGIKPRSPALQEYYLLSESQLLNKIGKKKKMEKHIWQEKMTFFLLSIYMIWHSHEAGEIRK